MACFLVTAAEAVVVTAAAQGMKHREKKAIRPDFQAARASIPAEPEETLTWSRKLMWLARLLWGGALLLAFEHVWHGEVVPWFPFLTAAADPADTAVMLHEMATVGVTMALIVTLVWAVMVAAAEAILKRKPAPAAAG